MKYESFLIKYGEIGTKGKNRYVFEDALIKQIKWALRNVEGDFSVSKEIGRIYVDCQGTYDEDEVSQSEFEESLTQMAAELFASAQAMNIPVEKMRDHFVKSYDDFIANSPSPKLGKEAFEYFMSIIDQLIEKVTPDERAKINDNKHEDDSDDNPIN